MQHNDEADANEDEREVCEDHQTTDALGVGTEGVGGRHGLHGQARLHRVLRLDGAHAASVGHVSARAPDTFATEIEKE